MDSVQKLSFSQQYDYVEQAFDEIVRSLKERFNLHINGLVKKFEQYLNNKIKIIKERLESIKSKKLNDLNQDEYCLFFTFDSTISSHLKDIQVLIDRIDTHMIESLTLISQHQEYELKKYNYEEISISEKKIPEEVIGKLLDVNQQIKENTSILQFDIKQKLYQFKINYDVSGYKILGDSEILKKITYDQIISAIYQLIFQIQWFHKKNIVISNINISHVYAKFQGDEIKVLLGFPYILKNKKYLNFNQQKRIKYQESDIVILLSDQIKYDIIDFLILISQFTAYPDDVKITASNLIISLNSKQNDVQCAKGFQLAKKLVFVYNFGKIKNTEDLLYILYKELNPEFVIQQTKYQQVPQENQDQLFQAKRREINNINLQKDIIYCEMHPEIKIKYSFDDKKLCWMCVEQLIKENELALMHNRVQQKGKKDEWPQLQDEIQKRIKQIVKKIVK